MTSPRNKQLPTDDGLRGVARQQDASRAASNNTKLTSSKRTNNKWHSPLKSPTQPLSKSMIDPVNRMGTTGRILNMPASVLPSALNVCGGDAQITFPKTSKNHHSQQRKKQ